LSTVFHGEEKGKYAGMLAPCCSGNEEGLFEEYTYKSLLEATFKD
jgi:hypothetical protein